MVGTIIIIIFLSFFIAFFIDFYRYVELYIKMGYSKRDAIIKAFNDLLNN